MHTSASNPAQPTACARVEDVAAYLRISTNRAYELVKSGAIPKVPGLGRRIRVRWVDLEAFAAGEPVTR